MASAVSRSRVLLFILTVMLGGGILRAQNTALVLEREGTTVALEPYAPNILRVTMSTLKDQATAEPGYGIVAKPAAAGWAHEATASGDTYTSPRMTLFLAAPAPPQKRPDGSFWRGPKKNYNGVGREPYLIITAADGKPLLKMQGWEMAELNDKDGDSQLNNDRRSQDPQFYRVGATFASPDDEHYYGLGQNQEGYLDHRQHKVECWADYQSAGGPNFCVPFLVTNKGYGLLWDNPSKTAILPGFNEQTKWISQIGQRVSFFVVAGQTTDEIYAGYRLLTGDTPMLPKWAYGLIQCKQRYSTQAEMLAVAKGYRDRHLPIDMLVLDWFYYTGMGQMDFIKEAWPDPAEMNRQLHAMNIETMISVWPRFKPGTRYYETVKNNGYFLHHADGRPEDGMPYDAQGSDIDSTNPDAAKWYWSVIHQDIASKGFDSFWADETEPDLPPNGSYFKIGPGTEYFNIYPLFHTAAFYNGIRKDMPDTRALILSRDAYLGAQHNGAIFWSSDIFPTWDVLQRQVPTGLDVAASGIAYWGNDIGGWQGLPKTHVPVNKPLIDPSDARDEVGGYDDYPELYVRWYEYGVFQPNFRTHGTRPHNEVWSYGKQAEPILEKYLRLRYELMPYIYSLGYYTHETGAPFMRPLFMDFPNDPKVADMGDEYMFGPAFLVAPVTSQGQTLKSVYLPAGTAWYNYWSSERFDGGQTIQVNAPIDTIPLFVKAGSIVPLGSVVESTHDKQSIAHVKVFPGADADFTLYNDDGLTYAYEKGQSQVTRIHWDEKAHKLTQSGSQAWSDDTVIDVVQRP
ncbi:glycoside hydrolase family 31 protein [Acidicapsa acidisoli]|uniref:glycoside hydrolase family 31 protein n=1 Tax=Acidicapsa acidisoli TaxID=1615681 RepID=UPI0021E023E6|nr:TIM-barrel domain-containing protein [Acidicapsa acidisoli]